MVNTQAVSGKAPGNPCRNLGTHSPSPGKVIHGDCIDVLKEAPASCVDLVVTDPPYLVNFRDRSGRTILNDFRTGWITPAFREVYRVLKSDTFCLSFYGWHQAERFLFAWKKAGFRPVAHIVFRKEYASKVGIVGFRHEQLYVLAKGNPKPEHVLRDVLPWTYSGNRLHPTEKAVEVILPLIRAFSRPGGVVLDPFCGSGVTGVAALELGRRYICIEKDAAYFRVAEERLTNAAQTAKMA
jgi:adenine-specific DNA-methyltransferase